MRGSLLAPMAIAAVAVAIAAACGSRNEGSTFGPSLYDGPYGGSDDAYPPECTPGDTKPCSCGGYDTCGENGHWQESCECAPTCGDLGYSAPYSNDLRCEAGTCLCKPEGVPRAPSRCCCPTYSPYCMTYGACADIGLNAPDAGRCPALQCPCVPPERDGGVCCCPNHGPWCTDAGVDGGADGSDAGVDGAADAGGG